MKGKALYSILVIFFLVTFFLFYKGLKNPNLYTPKFELEKKIPSIKAKTLNGKKVLNSDEIFKNDKIYIFNIWASWCVPCQDEHPILMELSNQKTIEVIGLNYKDNSKNAKNFLKELGNPYKIILIDNDGTIAIEWGAYGVPETFLIYKKKVIEKFIGPLNINLLTDIKKKIDEIH